MKLLDTIFESVVDMYEFTRWTPEKVKQKLIDDPKLSNLDFTNANIVFNKRWKINNFSCKKHPEWVKEKFTDVGGVENGTSGCKMCWLEKVRGSRESKKKYTKELVKDIASRYETRKQFEKENQSAYQAAISFGPCYDLTTGEKVSCKIYSDGVMKNRPNTKNTFGFLDDVCSHMKFGGYYGEKFVYSYTFFDDKNDVVGIYVGITNDEERRKQQHLSPKENESVSSVGKFMKENPTFTFRYKKLTDMVKYELAKELEKLYEEKYKSKGYRILNIARTGGGGRTFIPDEYYINKAQQWVKEKLEGGEVPYIGDYYKYDPTNYKAIRSKNIMDIAFVGMKNKDTRKYSDQDIIDVAMSCDSYSDFYSKYKKSFYQQANRRSILDNIKQMFNDRLNK